MYLNSQTLRDHMKRLGGLAGSPIQAGVTYIKNDFTVLEEYPKLKLTLGRKVLEIRPTIKWDKGKAFEFLLESLESCIPLYNFSIIYRYLQRSPTSTTWVFLTTKALMAEAGIIYPSLQQHESNLLEKEESFDKFRTKETVGRKRVEECRKISDKDLERDDECEKHALHCWINGVTTSIASGWFFFHCSNGIEVAIMRVELQTGKKQQMDSHYVNAPVPYAVEENFEGYLPDHNDLTLAQILQDQETVYESLQRDGQFDTGNSSSTTTMGDRDGRLQSRENSSQTVNVDSQLAMDEAYARELQEELLQQELENQFSYASLNRTSATGTDVARAQSATSSSDGTSANNTATQVERQDNVDPDNMTYEELQSLGEAIGKESRGLSDELISYLPTSTYKNGLFSRREKIEECVICYMPYKNRDKLITLPCQHQYHKDCVSHWLKINKACPVCNEEVFGS
ncbi:hypothetical protein IEQ34_013939 [Dendrobium chrysotoxum]|uniref:RING-type domain-containing protein n=1 Tax=Dendrobium chrysotoxum TaxID=161865 RepID=A0AAV7GKP5_DENCH|nr:hypothetical protein IEQ34_013939 [Dendrobium chrysotoxum]